MMVRFDGGYIYFRDGEMLYYNNVLIKIKQVDIGSWDIINTSNSKVRNLVTTDDNEIYLKLIERFIDDVGINLKDDEHLKFVDDTNKSVRANTQ